MEPDYKAILKRILLKTHWTLSHPSMGSAMVMSAVHGMQYNGPSLGPGTPEWDEACDAVGLPRELPEPTYPKEEFRVFIGPDEMGTKSDNPDIIICGYGKYCDEEVLVPGGLTREQAMEVGRAKAKELGHHVCVGNTGSYIDCGEEEAFYAQFSKEGHTLLWWGDSTSGCPSKKKG